MAVKSHTIQQGTHESFIGKKREKGGKEGSRNQSLGIRTAEEKKRERKREEREKK